MNLRLSIGAVLLLLVVIFTVQNAAVVDINFLFWKLSVSRALMIFFVAIIGFAVGWISANVHRQSRPDKQRS